MKYAAALLLIALVACSSQPTTWVDHGIGGNGGQSASVGVRGGRSATAGGMGHNGNGGGRGASGNGAGAASGGMGRR
jgi:hypothetical protein